LPGRFRVVEGNYDTYLLLSRDSAAEGPGPQRDGKPKAEKRQTRPDVSPSSPARKRKFPYRKTSDLEAEILKRESRIDELHHLLALPETHRDGDRVRQFKAEIAEQQEALQTLYAHWEEAVELNW
jgi:hypothetical protein